MHLSANIRLTCFFTFNSNFNVLYCVFELKTVPRTCSAIWCRYNSSTDNKSTTKLCCSLHVELKHCVQSLTFIYIILSLKKPMNCREEKGTISCYFYDPNTPMQKLQLEPSLNERPSFVPTQHALWSATVPTTISPVQSVFP